MIEQLSAGKGHGRMGLIAPIPLHVIPGIDPESLIAHVFCALGLERF